MLFLWASMGAHMLLAFPRMPMLDLESAAAPLDAPSSTFQTRLASRASSSNSLCGHLGLLSACLGPDQLHRRDHPRFGTFGLSCCVPSPSSQRPVRGGLIQVEETIIIIATIIAVGREGCFQLASICRQRGAIAGLTNGSIVSSVASNYREPPSCIKGPGTLGSPNHHLSNGAEFQSSSFTGTPKSTLPMNGRFASK